MATLENRSVFYGVNSQDRSDRIQLEAATERGAKIELLDQLGYAIEQSGKSFVLCDVDNVEDTVPVPGATSFENALDLVLKQARWEVSEPIEMIGGTMSGGMGYDDEQNGW